MKKLSAMMIAGAALAVLGSAVHAGAKYKSPVYISPDYRYASGAMGTARSSPDLNQAIGCAFFGSTVYGYVECFAVNASGAYLTCYNRLNADMKQAVSVITDSSFISFEIDPADPSKCSYVYVGTASSYEPTVP